MVGTDLVVVGAGPGEYMAAVRTAQLRMEVVVAERDACGGTCLNCGCIPAKALYKNAQIMGCVGHSGEFKTEIGGYRLDMEQMQARENKTAKTLTGGVEYLLKSNRVTIEKDCTKVIKVGLVKAINKGDTVKRLETERILIVSGSKSSRFPIEGMNLEGVIAGEEALDMKAVPKEIVVINGGAIDIESVGTHQPLSAKVVVVEFMPCIIPNVNVEITAGLKSLLEKRGAPIMTGSKAEKIEKKGNNLFVQVDVDDKKQVLSYGQVLVSAGRKVDADGLDLDGAGVRYDHRGVRVDEDYETNVSGIYAIRDVTERVTLAHVTSEEGKTAVERMVGKNIEVDYSLISNSIFIFPDVSSIGLSGEQARGQGIECIINKHQFSGNSKALIMGSVEGMVKAIATKDKSRLLGVHTTDPNASDLITEAAIAMNGMLTVEEAVGVMHRYSTSSEALDEAMSSLLGKAVHIPPVKSR